MEAAGFCGMEVATRGLVGGSGSSSPPELDSPGSQEHLGMFELVSSCCSEEVRGETPGREDCPLDPNNAELDPGGGGGKIKDQKGLGRLTRDCRCLSNACEVIYGNHCMLSW
jgi:hypothetical protein